MLGIHSSTVPTAKPACPSCCSLDGSKIFRAGAKLVLGRENEAAAVALRMLKHILLLRSS